MLNNIGGPKVDAQASGFSRGRCPLPEIMDPPLNKNIHVNAFEIYNGTGQDG